MSGSLRLVVGCALLIGCAAPDGQPTASGRQAEAAGAAGPIDPPVGAPTGPIVPAAGEAVMGAAGVGGANPPGATAETAPPATDSPAEVADAELVELTWLGNSVWVLKYRYMEADKVVVLDTNIANPWPDVMEVLGVGHVDYVFCGHGNFDHCDGSDTLIGFFGGQLIAATSNCRSYGLEDRCLSADEHRELVLEDAGLFITTAPVEHSFGSRATGDDPFGYAIRFPNGFTLYYIDTVGPLPPVRDGVVAQMRPFPEGVTLFVSMIAGDAELSAWADIIRPRYYIPQHTPLLDFTPNLATACSNCATRVNLAGIESFSHSDYITTYEATGQTLTPVDKGYREAFRP